MKWLKHIKRKLTIMPSYIKSAHYRYRRQQRGYRYNVPRPIGAVSERYRGQYLLRRGPMRSMIGGKPAPHLFKRFTQNIFSTSAGTTISGIFNTAGTAFNTFNLQFRLEDLPNASEITALYDQYMITKVVVKFIPTRTISETTNGVPTGGLAGARLLSVIDNDDGSNITADQGREYSTCKITEMGKIHKRVLTPAILRQMYESNISTAYTPSFKQWVSTTDPTAQHFGLKGGIIMLDSAAVTNSVSYSIEATYYFKCKNVK